METVMTNRRTLNIALMACGLLLGTANGQNAQDDGRSASSRNQPSLMTTDATPERAAVKEGEEKFFDDDGGRVFIVRRERIALDKLKHHGGKIIAEPQVCNIFLGRAWSKTNHRARQSSFAELLATHDDANERAWLERAGVTSFSNSSLNYEESFDFGTERTISDMRVRAVLADMLNRSAVPRPTEQLIYMVFLPSGVRSTLGEMFGGKHYLAYHNFFYAGQGKVNYVVVPFDADAERMQTIARRALIEAVINADGTGWH